MKVAFFDRDGTITQDYPDEKWTYIENPVLMPYAKQVLHFLCRIGYQIIIVTNQYLIGENFITEYQYHNYNQKLLNMLKEDGIFVLDVFYCPHSRILGCDCMKPKTGMIKQALDKYPTIDLQNSLVVGDSICDMQLAERIHAEAYGIDLVYDYEKFTKIQDLKELFDLFKKVSHPPQR